MPDPISRTPFGNPDGSRSDIQEVVDNFVTFADVGLPTGLGIEPDDLSVRVIVGAKGSGKTVYLRRLQAAAANNDSIYADNVQQDLPVTSNIVKFCQCFGRRDLTEKWMQLWFCAILRSLVTHLLHAKPLASRLGIDHRDELESYPPEFVPRSRRQVSVYSQVTGIIQSHRTNNAFSRYFDDPTWAELSTTVGEIIAGMPPIYFFIDSVDEEYASAPMYWLQCQQGLFFRTMRFLRDQHLGGRLHVIVCVRDHVLASVLRGEHQNRYRGEPHIKTLGWEYDTAEFFLKEKIARLHPSLLVREPESQAPNLEHWLGLTFIENLGRSMKEPLLPYLLRHTRLLPRDIVILGNRLCDLSRAARRNGQKAVPQEAVRGCVREASRSFGSEQLAICANHIVSSGMPGDAIEKGYEDVYIGDMEYARSFAEDLLLLIQEIGRDRFGGDELSSIEAKARELFGEHSDPLSVLWQNGLLGYVESTPDGNREVFFSELNCDHFTLPLTKDEYLLHSSMIDAADIKAVGPPVGQGRMSRLSVGPGSPAGGPGSPSEDPDRIGEYPVLGVIGRGGMGTVYLAEDPGLERRVAIKVLPPELARVSGLTERFRREARVLAALSHPNIATIHSLEREDGTYFLVMEYVVGRNLEECVEDGPIPPARALKLGRQIARGLGAAHAKGVVHRDLKPSNIMLTPDGNVKILDFGIAKVVPAEKGSPTPALRGGPQTERGAILGTAGYMAPEQMKGREVDARADIFAFGCCLFECLSGRRAFDGRTVSERLTATMSGEPAWDALPEVPAGTVDLLRRCLEKEPDRRAAGITDVIAEIDRLLVR